MISEFRWVRIKRKSGSILLDNQQHARLGGGIHADAIIDRIVNNSIHIYAGELNMRKVKNTP